MKYFVTKVQNAEKRQRVKCGMIPQKNSANYLLPIFRILPPPVSVGFLSLQAIEYKQK